MPQSLKRAIMRPFARTHPLEGQAAVEPAPVEPEELFGRELEAMARRFPLLASYLDGTSLPLGERRAVFFDLIADHHPAAKEAAWRTQLRRLGTEAAEREIAESDLREGIPYSSNVKKFDDIWQRALPEIRRHEEAYGAAVFTESWPSYSRGRALAYYFENNPPHGRVLHTAPEREMEDWARARAADGSFTYETVGLGPNTDRAEDLTAMAYEDESYDLFICHRVLEHIFDEEAAMQEALRILRSGGCFNVSVPESMHLDETLEWCYPDATHHQHYRQYGADFAACLTAAGFEVEVGDWLLQRPAGELRSAGVYPLRIYNAYKP